MHPLLHGFAIGFSIAAPVGPIGLLCIRRSLAEGRAAGFVSGLGAATADALYGVLAALGLTAITHILLAYQPWLQFGGGAFLLYLGLATLRAPAPAPAASTPAAPHLLAAYGSTLILTLANPLTILSFLGIFAGLGVGAATSSAFAAGWLVVGVFLGSVAWWLFLSTAAGCLGRRLDRGGLRIVNLLSGFVIAAIGAGQLAGVLRSLR
ncbi:MAG: LysE family transporter [Verrucomicrobia bacterium]|nr:LysE family transporter [Verrucomicrobiota bacterium]